MKKFIIAILAFVYICTSAGIIVHTHYCMGEPVAWGLGHNKSKTCSKCGMEKSDEKNSGCCKDDYKVVKNNTDQKNTENVFHLTRVLGISLRVTFIELSSNNLLPVTEKESIIHPPSRSSVKAVYIRNCVFLI